jgi:uncharacterized protein (TIGR02217 family)
MTTGFHEVRFPLDIALGSSGGPRRRTDIVTTGSGREVRNARWHHSRRHYDAGYGVKSIEALAAVVAFFEERRGRLYGFRWHDRLDCRSGSPNAAPTPLDQLLGTGDGQQASFQLAKTYGGAHDPYIRPVRKPVAGTVRVAVAGQEQVPGADFTCDPASGLVTFVPNRVPPAGAAVTAGFAFDVPVRFDSDELDVDLSAFDAGAIPRIPLVEILL